MKVIHLGTFDDTGGAAKAMIRLHDALREEGIESSVFVLRKTSGRPDVLQHQSKSRRWMALASGKIDDIPRMCYPSPDYEIWSVGWRGMPPRRATLESFDIVHLHWINAGFLSINDIARIGKPLVWTLHDMWPFTGGCHYSNGCRRYIESCGRCPELQSTRDGDLSKANLRRKQRSWGRSNIHFVCPSVWLAGEAKKSSLLRNRDVRVIPNTINPTEFQPVERSVARDLLRLPRTAPLVLFGAYALGDSTRKGYQTLAPTLEKATQLMKPRSFEIVIFGGGIPGDSLFPCPIHHMGTLHDSISLRLLYSAANVVIIPSLEENLTNMAMESLACGTPVVAYDLGGNPDLVDHKQNGYLARKGDLDDFAKGIAWILQEEDGRRAHLAVHARQKVMSTFAPSVVVHEYTKLYHEVIEG